MSAIQQIMGRSVTCPEDVTQQTGDEPFAASSLVKQEPSCAEWGAGFSCSTPNAIGKFNWMFGAITQALCNIDEKVTSGSSLPPFIVTGYNTANNRYTILNTITGTSNSVNGASSSLVSDSTQSSFVHTPAGGTPQSHLMHAKFASTQYQEILPDLVYNGSNTIQANTVFNFTPLVISIPATATHALFAIRVSIGKSGGGALAASGHLMNGKFRVDINSTRNVAEAFLYDDNYTLPPGASTNYTPQYIITLYLEIPVGIISAVPGKVISQHSGLSNFITMRVRPQLIGFVRAG